MRTECLNHKFVFGSHMNTGRLVRDVADRTWRGSTCCSARVLTSCMFSPGHQRCTQSYVRRPYGVGLLVAGYDKSSGAHLYRTCPSGNFYEYKAYALGARSQSGRTYLEKHFEAFPEGELLAMIQASTMCIEQRIDSNSPS